MKMVKNKNNQVVNRYIFKRVIFMVSVLIIASCNPSPDRMVVKLNRNIETANQKITKFENRITGYKQKLEIMKKRALTNEGEATSKRNKQKQKEIEKLARKLDKLKRERGVDTNLVATDVIGEKLITVIQPEKRDFVKFLEVQGAVTSKENIMVASNTGGVIISILITEGQFVNVGQKIAIINSETLRSAIAEVQNALVLAKTVYDKQNKLWNELKVGTEIQYLQAKNNKENLEKRLATLNVQLSDATVKSPISGIVDEVYAKQGEMAGPGSPIARVVNLNKVQVEAEVPENYIGKFAAGDKIEVYFQSLNLTRTATLRAVSQNLNPGNRTFKIEADLLNADKQLKPYLLATVKLKEYENKNQIIIPTKLIQEGNNGTFVLTANGENVIEKKQIELGETYNGSTEISTGLIGDERIIDLGFKNVHVGDKVNIDKIKE